MTQDYEPIEITESTPEPKENGIYLLTITQCGERYCVPVWRDELWRDIEGDHTWSELVDSIKNTWNPTIQSLAAHDAQIRAEALTLTEEEAGIAAEALDDADDESWYYDDKQQVIRDVLKSVASFRKEPKQ